MSTTRKAATSNADLQKDLEKRIGKFVADSVILLDHFNTAFQQTRIPVQLPETDSRHNIRHIALIPRSDNIVLPGYGSDSEKAELIRHVKTR